MASSPPTISISKRAARRFLVSRFALDGFQNLPTVADAIRVLESVQEDSINVCGRMHDLILWPRVQNYSPDLLHEALYTAPRQAWEYYFPNLHVLPLADFPHFVRAMQARSQRPGRWGALTEEEKTVAEKIFAHVDTHGPLRTRTAGADDGYTVSGWGTRTRIVTQVTEKLWLNGHLAIARRDNFERSFDRTSRLLPEVADIAASDAHEEALYLTRKRLRTRRLFRLKSGDKTLLGTDAFRTVQIEGDRRPWHILSEDEAFLHAAVEYVTATPETSSKTVHLLGPLDPLVYDRTLLEKVFDFPYIWEVYTPAPKRRWGYYVLPILWGDRLIGRLDPKLDRRTGTLFLNRLSREPHVSDADAQAALPLLKERLRLFVQFLGAEKVTLAREANTENFDVIFTSAVTGIGTFT